MKIKTKNKTLVLLAGGLGARFNGLKQTYLFNPQRSPLACYAIYDALKYGFNNFVAIVNDKTKIFFEKIFKKFGISNNSHCVVQQSNIDEFPKSRVKPAGTAHALYVARNSIHTPFVLINCDDFYGAAAYEQASDFLDNMQYDKQIGIVAYNLNNTLSVNGPVSRAIIHDDKNIINIDEYINIKLENGEIIGELDNKRKILSKNNLTSVNFWILPVSILDFLETQWFNFLKNLKNPEIDEFYLPNTIFEISKKQNMFINLLKNNSDSFRSVTYKEDITYVEDYLNYLTVKNIYPKKFFD